MRHPSFRALALLLSVPLTALAQAPSVPGAPPTETPPPIQVTPPPELAPPPPTPPPQVTPPPELAPLPEAAPPPAATPAASDARASTSPAPAPAAKKTAPRAQPKPLPPPVVEPIPDAEPPVEAAPIPAVAAWLGVNTLWVPSEGFDPFSEDDALSLFDLGAALSLGSAGAVDIAAVVGWGAASSDADYRSQAAKLDVMRLSAGPELRGSISDRFYWHGRLSPTATRLSASLDEASSGATFSDDRWAFGLDAALGVDLRFAETAAPLPAALGFFVRVEAGYAWAQSAELELEASGDAPVRSETLALPDLALGGPSLRASLGAGF